VFSHPPMLLMPLCALLRCEGGVSAPLQAPIEKTWSMPQLPSKPQDVEGAVGRQCQGQRSWAMPIACCTWNKMSRQTRVLPIKSPAKADSSVRSVRAPLPNEADSFRKSFPSLERARLQPAGCASRGRLRPRIRRSLSATGLSPPQLSRERVGDCQSLPGCLPQRFPISPARAHHCLPLRASPASCRVPCRLLHRALLHLSGGDSCGARMLVQNCAAIFTLPSSSRSWRPPSRACACAARAPACTSTAGCP